MSGFATGCTLAVAFFFSSRRRHTRFSRDWSSDVCSSDLSERNNAFARASYNVGETFEVFAEGSWARSVVNTGASYNYYGGNLNLRLDNAFLNPITRQAMIDNNIDTAKFGLVYGVSSPRVESRTSRFLVGTTGMLGDNWELDAYYQYGRSVLNTDVYGTTNTARMALAFDAVVNPANGQVVCRSALANPASNCVPYNAFGEGNASQQAVDYVTGTPWFNQYMEQQVASATVTRTAATLPAGDLITAFGVEHRRESGRGDNDPDSNDLTWLFGNFSATPGENRVNEAFAEALVPVFEDKLTVNAAARLADYSYSGTAFTWKLGAVWTPTEQWLIRGVRSRDIRAPNLGNLYQTGATQRYNLRDPWFGGTIRNIMRISTGNLDLRPEVSDTHSIGVVFSPSAVPGLHASFDYYHIEITDAISTLSNQQMVDRCFEGDPQLCRLVQRDSTGALSGLT